MGEGKQITIEPGARRGSVAAPRSKSHEHRLLIADFLAGDYSRLAPAEGDADDIQATKRCLLALAGDDTAPFLDCGESGSTRRFLAPIAAALGKKPVFKTAGRLADRPQMDYDDLQPGEFKLAGDVSSQFVTGLLFALPLLKGDSFIRFTSPLESKGYVEMTRRVLVGAGIYVGVRDDGYDIPGGQAYHAQPDAQVEGDWSGAAFWFAMNALGSDIEVTGLDAKSVQPDRVVQDLLQRISTAWSGERVFVDVSECPDLFPALSVVAAASPGETLFTGTRRLRLKESDRTAAMEDVLKRFGAEVERRENEFSVRGAEGPFRGGEIETGGDHRVAMAAAVGATQAEEAVTIDDAACAAKSYPAFFADFGRLGRMRADGAAV